jgi:hypothetical protein
VEVRLTLPLRSPAIFSWSPSLTSTTPSFKCSFFAGAPLPPAKVGSPIRAYVSSASRIWGQRGPG